MKNFLTVVFLVMFATSFFITNSAEAVDDPDSRYGIAAAVVQKNFDRPYAVDYKLTEDLLRSFKKVGVDSYWNDEVLAYLRDNAENSDVRLKVRDVAKDNRDLEDAFMFVMLNVESVKKVNELYEATARVSLDLIDWNPDKIVSLDLNSEWSSEKINTFNRTFKCVAETEDEAIHNAKEHALSEIVSTVAAQAGKKVK